MRLQDMKERRMESDIRLYSHYVPVGSLRVNGCLINSFSIRCHKILVECGLTGKYNSLIVLICLGGFKNAFIKLNHYYLNIMLLPSYLLRSLCEKQILNNYVVD